MQLEEMVVQRLVVAVLEQLIEEMVDSLQVVVVLRVEQVVLVKGMLIHQVV